MTKPNDLSTERLLLRAFHVERTAAIHALFSDPDVRRYLWDDEIVSSDTVREVIEASDASFTESGFGLHTLHLRSAPTEVIGFTGCRPFEGGPRIELMYGLLPAHWGRGLVTEACRAELQHLFERVGATEVLAATDVPNTASVRVMERLGMTFEARRDLHGLDTLFYRLANPA